MTNPTFDSYQSSVDDVQVVHVDTHGMPENKRGPIIRVYLNDEPIFENPEYPVCFERTIPERTIPERTIVPEQSADNEQGESELLEALEFIVNDIPSPGEDAKLTAKGYNKACAAIRNHLPIVHRTSEIVVTVQGGLVEDVTNIPPGTVVKVMDLDDESEDKCLITFWGKD